MDRFDALVVLAVVGALGVAKGCAAGPCDPQHPDMAALVATKCNKARVQAECPELKRGQCPRGSPCPECPLVEECDQLTERQCLQ